MNPLTQIKSRIKQRKDEVLNRIPESASYHSQYRNSAYIYAGQLSYKLTEGDLLAIFSQYGEIVDVNLVRCEHVSVHGLSTSRSAASMERQGSEVGKTATPFEELFCSSIHGTAMILVTATGRPVKGLSVDEWYARLFQKDKQTNESRGFAFLAYDDQRSTDLAVDNLNGADIGGRIIAVDHVLDYKRLVEQGEAGDPGLLPPPPPQRHEAREPDGAILAGAEAEAAEDEYGVMSDPEDLPSAPERSGQGRGAPSKEPWEPGGGSIAELLRKAENMVPSFKRKPVDNPLLAMNQEVKRLKSDKKEKMEKKAKKEKKDKKEKKEKKAKKERHEKRDRSTADRSPPSDAPRCSLAAKPRGQHEARQEKRDGQERYERSGDARYSTDRLDHDHHRQGRRDNDDRHDRQAPSSRRDSDRRSAHDRSRDDEPRRERDR